MKSPMAKDTFYFQHDYNARNDEKILELRSIFGAEGYGVYWMLLESMAETLDGKLNLSLIGGLSLGYGVAKGRLSEIVEFCVNVGLFEREMQFFLSKRMVQHKSFRVECSKNGKEGALKRWGGYGDPNSKGKERKGKEIKYTTTIEQLTNEMQLELSAMACSTTLEAYTKYAIPKAKLLIASTDGKYSAQTLNKIMIQDYAGVKQEFERKSKPKTSDDKW
jgi:hypothetical protein